MLPVIGIHLIDVEGRQSGDEKEHDYLLITESPWITPVARALDGILFSNLWDRMAGPYCGIGAAA